MRSFGWVGVIQTPIPILNTDLRIAGLKYDTVCSAMLMLKSKPTQDRPLPDYDYELCSFAKQSQSELQLSFGLKTARPFLASDSSPFHASTLKNHT